MGHCLRCARTHNLVHCYHCKRSVCRHHREEHAVGDETRIYCRFTGTCKGREQVMYSNWTLYPPRIREQIRLYSDHEPVSTIFGW